MLSLHQAK